MTHLRIRIVSLCWAWALALACGCADEPMSLEADPVPEGLDLNASHAMERIEVLAADGSPVASFQPPVPRAKVHFPVPLDPGQRYRVVGHSRHGTAHTMVAVVREQEQLAVAVEAPLGQVVRRVKDGQVLEYPIVEGSPAQGLLLLTASSPLEGTVYLGHGGEEADTAVPLVWTASGDRRVVPLPLPDSGEQFVRIAAGQELLRITLRARTTTLAEAQQALKITDIAFPAASDGLPDVGRAASRITLPSRLWDQVLRKTGLGARARAVELPWAYLGVELQNSGDRAISVLLASRVVDGAGQDAPAFRPNLRKYDSDTGVVTVLLRVPAGQRARGALPLFVDPGELGHGALEFERILEVTPLGSNEPLLVRRQDLVVDQGNPLATFGFLAVVLAALVGLGLVTLRGPRWLGSQATSTLMTVALFGNLIFVLAAASHLVGMGFGAFLGPFSSLVTGLLDEAFRFALLATLITLLPAPGIVTLTLVVSALMRGIALGAFTPGDLLVLCSSVVWLEFSLWLVGITRGTRWRDEGRVLRWARLSVGFGLASVANALSGLAAAAILYRLYFATWYVLLIAGVPGFLYVLLACWMATGFAASLREVEA